MQQTSFQVLSNIQKELYRARHNIGLVQKNHNSDETLALKKQLHQSIKQVDKILAFYNDFELQDILDGVK